MSKILYINIGDLKKGDISMAIVNSMMSKGISLVDDLARYVQVCGKRSILETKSVSKISPDGLSPVINRAKVPMSMKKSMPYDEAVQMARQYKGKGFSYPDQRVNVQIDGDNYVGNWLGGGGSKCAYRINYNGEDVCLLLPHSSWLDALREPANTQIVKKMGLITNDYCKIVPVKIGGQDLPAIVTKPYDKHSFKIFDKKNPNDSLDKYVDVEALNEHNITGFMDELIKDCKIVTDNGLNLGYDSYNIALVNGKPRLYINDLPYKSEDLISSAGDKKQLLRYNLENAIDALNGSFSWDAGKINPFIDKLGKLDFTDSLVDKIMLQLKN